MMGPQGQLMELAALIDPMILLCDSVIPKSPFT